MRKFLSNSLLSLVNIRWFKKTQKCVFIWYEKYSQYIDVPCNTIVIRQDIRFGGEIQDVDF